jgi:dTDP-4-dehydrorhamnose 3,5-epimerase
MQIERLRIPELVRLTPKRHGDERGFFSETWTERGLVEAGIFARFVQDNHSRSAAVGTVRGLHFQAPPYAQGKLVRVVKGAIFDVAVDIRVGSPTYGQHVALTLSVQNWAQLWVPPGFAHGFCTTEPDTEVIYKVTDYYTPTAERSMHWDDPALGIEWPVRPEAAVLSAKDQEAPLLAGLPAYFHY